jgi:glucose-1-phosphate adenylyltransferase
MNIGSDPSTLCVILGGGRGKRLYPLTRERAKPAVPLGGKYRLIDVPISNCLNSGLNQIYVITQFQSESLHRHVKSTYRFDQFSEGFVEILAAQQRMTSDAWYQGTADAVRQNLVHLQDRSSNLTLILSGDQLYRMNFRELLDYHRKKEADITLAVLPVPASSCSSLGILKMDPHGQIIRFAEKPKTAAELEGLESDPESYSQFHVNAPDRPYLGSMGIYVFNTEVLFHELRTKSYADFGIELFPEAIRHLRVFGYVFDDYWEDIGTVRSFHEANLELASPRARFHFHSSAGPIFTRSRLLPPTKAHQLTLKDSIVADGCEIGELYAESSIVGIRSKIGNNVRLHRTLVMGNDFYEFDEDRRRNARLGRPDLGIGDHVTIKQAIVDKDVRIGSNVYLSPPSDEDMETDSFAVRDGVLCIFKGAIIPSGTRIGE